MDNSVYMRRTQLVNGDPSNGLELWRRLYEECEGGAEQVMLAGVTRFMNFEKCTSKAKLSTFLGEWETLRRTYGDHLPDVFLYTLLLNMLPDDVAKEVRDRRQTLNTTQRALDYIMGSSPGTTTAS